jgi:heme-degrading monooxygenase HmoA
MGPMGPGLNSSKAILISGTQLLRDPSRALYYFTVDFWDSEAAFQSFLLEHRAPYDELERATETFTFKERRIGSFTMNP